jgi:uncharacterized protein CbrC (UPF0167 family)
MPCRTAAPDFASLIRAAALNRRLSCWCTARGAAAGAVGGWPIGPSFTPIKYTGARDKVAKKTYIRAVDYPQPAFDKWLAQCKADSSWRTRGVAGCGHDIMVDKPDELTELLIGAA